MEMPRCPKFLIAERAEICQQFSLFYENSIMAMNAGILTNATVINFFFFYTQYIKIPHE
jgi:hypothetical protein